MADSNFYTDTNLYKTYSTEYWFGASLGSSLLDDLRKKYLEEKEHLDAYLRDTKKAKALVNGYIDGVINAIGETTEDIMNYLETVATDGMYIKVGAGEGTLMSLLQKDNLKVPFDESKKFVGGICIFVYSPNYSDYKGQEAKMLNAIKKHPNFDGLFVK